MTRWGMILFFVVVAAQVAGLLAFAGLRETVLARGREVVLQTVPIDPRSLLQGDYAILDYEIAELPPFLDDTSPGTPVFVELREGAEVWTAGRYSTRRENVDSYVYIRGTVVNQGHRLDFGIGTFFIPEGTGGIIENAADVKVRVSLDRNGRAVIKQVLVDGQPFDPYAQPGEPAR